METFNGINVINEEKVSNEHALKLLKEFDRESVHEPEFTYYVMTLEDGTEGLFEYGADKPIIEFDKVRDNRLSLTSY